jgi:hypothetical protein
MTRRNLALILLALLIGAVFAVSAPQVSVLGLASNGQGCALGHKSGPVGNHSKPCPPGCAVGNPHVVGNASKPCPPGCAIGNPHATGNPAKPCPKPPGHQPQPPGKKKGHTPPAPTSTTTSVPHGKPHGHKGK